jgi:RNA polymerase sigma-70 factor (ECF subfamily)
LFDVSSAEDVVHDVFVSFINSASRFRLTGSLKGYLATCVANGARNRNKTRQRHPNIDQDASDVPACDSCSPHAAAIFGEQSRRLTSALAQLPYEQREVVLLHLHTGLRFKAIAELQGISVNTVQGRYRYALNRLRYKLNGEVNK